MKKEYISDTSVWDPLSVVFENGFDDYSFNFWGVSSADFTYFITSHVLRSLFHY